MKGSSHEAALTDNLERICTPDLTYYERRAQSESLTVFLHGLGLDATDYFGYLKEHPKQHCIAVSLRGFDASDEQGLAPVSFSVHAAGVSALLVDTQKRFPDKKLVLVGFSLGADMVLRLAQHWTEFPTQAPRLGAALLLDPNINHSTMTISRVFAEADPNRPADALDQLVALVTDPVVLEPIREYVSKIQSKDFQHIRRLSQDMVQYWQPSGYAQIGQRLASIAQHAGRVRVVFSAPYKPHLPAVQKSVKQHVASPPPTFKLRPVEHFDLIRNDVLTRELALLNRRPTV